jgi:hypothetical protein
VPKAINHQIGSRPWLLSRMEPGDRLLFEVKIGQETSTLQQQITTDAGRTHHPRGTLKTRVVIGIEIATRECFDIIMVEYPMAGAFG